MSSPGTLRFAELNSKPSAPPAGYNILYVKVDDILYLQDSSGIETPLGSSAAITSLNGEATGAGPGATTVTLSNAAVIGKVLTGFVAGPNSLVAPTDSILQAIQKLQAQVAAVGAITSLTGDVSATGPGAAAATVNSVGGKTAAAIATSVNDTLAATASNTASTIVKRDASGNFAANLITANLSGNATTANSFTGSLAGDVTGTQGATVVALVGGSSAANVHLAELAANAATASNTASTIVKRDASGNFAANLITANLNGNVSGSAASFTGSLAGDVTGTQGATVLSATSNGTLTTLSALTTATNLISVGTITTGTWSATTIAVNKGGTGQTSYTDGQLLIGNTTGNTLTKATLTPGTGIAIANGGGSITISGNSTFAQTTKTNNYTILSTDSIIFVDSTSGAFNLTLPSPTALAGKLYRVIDTTGFLSTNNVTLVPSGSEKIEGLAASKALQTAWGWFDITTNGTDWFVG